METYIESRRVAVASGPSWSGSAQTQFSRVVLPILVATVGIFIGTATGLVIGRLTTPGGAPFDSGDYVQASATTAQAEISPAVNANPAPAIQPAVAPTAAAASQPDADTSQPAAATSQSAAEPASLRTSPANPAFIAPPASAAQTAQIGTPVTLRAASRRVAGKMRHAARLIAKPDAMPAAWPDARPARLVLASAPLADSAGLNDSQWSLGNEAKPSSFSTEGDLTVTDYDAETGTIETSDGRTFTLGTTVSASDATSWEDYRSDVHFRCGQNGSCMLMRAGVVAPNARLI